ncbi:MAG: zinc-binding dehydrogenase [Polyangiaceae bacterium]|nr:zinc-binding dehydrogenase [Polyangiaceae bacterium]
MMKATMLTKKGGPEVLELVELPTPEPGPGELRVRVLATGVGSTDVTMRRGYYPFAPPIPFIPGYETVGIVDAIGSEVTGFKIGDRVCALLVYGGYATHVVRAAAEWVKVPEGLDDAEVVALVLNYVTAYQAIHRQAKVTAGQSALVTGASGGVGQALVQLLGVAGVRTIAAASSRSHALLQGFGAETIEGRTAPVDGATLALVPGGVDAAFDGIGGDQLRQCIRATKKGGVVVWYGFMGVGTSLAATARNYFDIFVGSRLRGRRGTFYGITALYRKDPAPFREDLPRLFELLATGRIKPRIGLRLPLSRAREANEAIEHGGVDGKIVLVAT